MQQIYWYKWTDAELLTILKSKYKHNSRRMIGKLESGLTTSIILTFRGEIIPNQVVFEKMINEVDMYIPRV